MEVCTVCEKRKGRRKCHLFINELICSRCCARERNASGCTSCRFFRRATRFRREKKARRVLDRAAHLEERMPHLYRFLTRKQGELREEVGASLKWEKFVSSMENMGRLDENAFASEMRTTVEDLLERDYYQEITFSEEVVSRLLEEEGLDCHDLLEYDPYAILNDERGEQERSERLRGILENLLEGKNEREGIILKLINILPELESDHSHLPVTVLCFNLDSFLAGEGYRELLLLPMLTGVVFNTLEQISRRDYIAGRRRKSGGLYLPDRLGGGGERDQDDSGIIIP